MEFGDILKKRLNGMAVRILACIEHTLASDLGDMKDDEKFILSGSELNIIRGEILNAAGDTTRSLMSIMGDVKPGKLSLSREMISAISNSIVDISDNDDPVFIMTGDFNLLIKIREMIGAGVVYNKKYTCAGLDNVIDSLIPFLDSVQIAGIRIARGDYKDWRDEVCKIYLEGLEEE